LTKFVEKDLIKGISEEVEYHKKEVQILRVEKEQLEGVLATKATDVRENLQDEATRVEEDLKKNLSG
jgi:chromosome segregation ATPase